MLPLLRDRYCAALRPDGVAIVRRRRGLAPALDLKEAVACAPAAEGPAWAPAVAALSEFLARPATGPGDLWVVLSSHFARFMVIPWNDELASPEELQAYAAAVYENVFGEAASAAWDIRTSPERPGTQRIACAVDRALLEALDQAVAGTRVRLASVQPHLMACYNALAPNLRGRDFVFLVSEGDRASLLAAAASQWRAVRSAPAPDHPAAIAALVEREINLSDLGSETAPEVYIHAPQRAGLVLPAVKGKAPRVLELKSMSGFSPITDGRFAMAAAAAA
ncbi:MAG TPA: hypothetical protein VLC55_01030 [Burkholderiales bacterium]|nr:hypothetical protein [Burkholderiales bacterium]